MSYSERDIARLLYGNPDLSIMADGTIGAPVVYVPPKMSEYDMQTEVFRQCAIKAETNPDWQMVAAIPNGQYRPGQRLEAGTRKGFPDLIVPIARHSRIGLALELKVTPHKPTTDQLWWHRQLR